MSNELLFLIASLVDITAVFVAARFGSAWLLGTIAANLVLITVFGAKLVTTLWFVTNVGNVFYACVFLATYFLIERGRTEKAWTAIWYGVFFVAFFTVMSQLVIRVTGLATTQSINDASSRLFSFSPRIALASMFAFIFAQHVNIVVYESLRSMTGQRLLWLRSNVANIFAQLIDSVFFFTIAFFDVPGSVLLQTIIVGWLVKVVVVALGMPFLYADRHLRSREVHEVS